MFSSVCWMLIFIGILVILFSLAGFFTIERYSSRKIIDIIPLNQNRFSTFLYNTILSAQLPLSPTQKMLTKLTVIFLIFMVLFGIFLSTFLNVMNTEGDLNNKYIANQTVINQDDLLIDNKTSNIFWFIHLSDTHLSYFQDKDRKSDLIKFCSTVIPMIKPTVLLLTGDITDARTRLPLGSDQYRDEWLMYQEVREKCMKANPNLIWLDIKGNHDSFNTYNNFNNFHNFTVQSNMSVDGRSYRYELRTKDGNRYSFIGADACLKPGVKRPFNFVGQFESDELQKLMKFRKQSLSTNYTIWYGHYPTSSIFNKEKLRGLINGPYLCGHYHTIHGLVTSMISTQQQGFLEAETGDWKDYRTFRIAAIDHGLFTFVNYFYRPHQSELPLILITNPRSILHQMEHLEPFWRTARSTHIRVLIFSKHPIIEARGFISDQQKSSPSAILESFTLKKLDDSLWVAEWNAKKYSAGLYYLTVIASDEHSSNQVTVPFSLDRTKPSYWFSARLILRIDFRTTAMFIFAWGFFFSTIPLILLRVLTSNDQNSCQHMFNQSRRRYIQKILFRLYLLSHQDRLFYFLIFIPFYTLIGPWFIAHMVSDYVGIVFAWGQFIDGTFLPVGFTFIFGAIFMFALHIPFMVGLSILINIRYKDHFAKKTNNGERDSINRIYYLSETTFYVICLLAITLFQGLAASLFYSAYGFLAFATNFQLYCCFIYLYLIRNVLVMNDRDFKLIGPGYQQCSQEPPRPNSEVNNENN